MPGERSSVPAEVDDADYDPELTTVRAISVLGMVFGAVGMAVMPFGFMRFHEGAIAGHAHISLYGSIQASTSMDSLGMLFGTFMWMGLCGLLFLASVGCLKLAWWGRSVLLMWATGAIMLAIAGGFLYFRWLLPPWRDNAAQVRGVFDPLVTFIAWVGSFVLAVTVMIYFNRPHIREYFRQKQAGNG